METQLPIEITPSVEVPFAEAQAVQYRRQGLFADSGVSPSRWGLAFSGGGIRSATFCLGVLQGLAKRSSAASSDTGLQKGVPLLGRFDYLSTVSGGGYIGGFFSALFRSRPGDSRDPKTRAEEAFSVLQADPPGRLGNAAGATSSTTPRPLEWLRENGRYLAPNNSGDLFTDIAIAVRNLCAVHYVIGTALLCLFLLMYGYRLGVTNHAEALGLFGKFGVALELATQPSCVGCDDWLWVSPWFGVQMIFIAFVLVPLGVAYWFEQEKSRFYWITDAVIVAMALLACALFVLVRLNPQPEAVLLEPIKHPLAFSLFLFVVTLLMANIYFLLIKWFHGTNTVIYRARATRYFSHALVCTLALTMIGLVETVGQSIYLWLMGKDSISFTLAAAGSAVTAVVVFFRSAAPRLTDPAKKGLLSKLPLNLILAVIGLTMLTLLIVTWHVVATAIFFQGNLPIHGPSELMIASATVEELPNYHLFVLAFAVLVTFAAGYFVGFVNLSGLQTMYGARLTRAYLGASNRARFAEKSFRVSEPHPADDFSTEEYYRANSHMGPVHLINVTVNATTGKGDQITQRDRHGMPMSIGPGGVSLSGSPCMHPNAERLSVGRWIGISGAAFTTGLGRGSGLGPALVFGLTNIRLGWWWDSGVKAKYRILSVWRNQAHLSRELRAKFVGSDEKHWYLSDGGHYENTGVLELLRRRLDFVVCADCGADPDYEMGDVANLMRISRIDLGAEFTMIPPALCPMLAKRAHALQDYIATDERELKARDGQRDNKCMLLYRVNYRDEARITYLLVLKPRLISDAPLDVAEYQAVNPSFPQQTTFDQFFDEAQWESYRKLGVLISSTIFE